MLAIEILGKCWYSLRLEYEFSPKFPRTYPRSHIGFFFLS